MYDRLLERAQDFCNQPCKQQDIPSIIYSKRTAVHQSKTKQQSGGHTACPVTLAEKYWFVLHGLHPDIPHKTQAHWRSAGPQTCRTTPPSDSCGTHCKNHPPKGNSLGNGVKGDGTIPFKGVGLSSGPMLKDYVLNGQLH